MFVKENEEIIGYFFRYMISKDNIAEFLKEKKISVSTKSTYDKIMKKLMENEDLKISIGDIRSFARNKWRGTKEQLHLRNLSSGLLRGHSWHGSMPSFLHLSLQNKVREAIENEMELNKLLEMGEDIMKQEYFIVATHDLCETAIIKNHNDVIPSIAIKSVSDFIFDGIPYDLKNSGVPEGSNFEEAQKKPNEFAETLLGGADSLRKRKEAEGSLNDWAQNRFYVILKDPEDWINKPSEILKKLIAKTPKLEDAIEISVGSSTIFCQFVFID